MTQAMAQETYTQLKTSKQLMNAEGLWSDALLQLIDEWPESATDELIDLLRQLWKLPFGVSEKFTDDQRKSFHLHADKRYVKLATMGNVMNEDLMTSFRRRPWRRNAIAATLRGGRYVLEYQR